MSQHILLIEDEPNHALLVRNMLEDFDVEVTHADSGEKALDLAQTMSFDLVLMDVVLPGISGLEVAKGLRGSQTPNSAAPIIGLSTYFQPGEENVLLEAGVNDWLGKPLNSAKFKALVTRHLGLEA